MDKKIKEELNQIIEEKIKEKQPEHDHNNEHIHAVHSYDKYCTDCGTENPDYKEPEFFCANKQCQHPIGTPEEAQNSKKCTKCGSLNAISKEDLIAETGQ